MKAHIHIWYRITLPGKHFGDHRCMVCKTLLGKPMGKAWAA